MSNLSFIAAIVYTVLIGIVILFQLALALGAPWGHLSMGGKFKGKYPPAMRVSAVLFTFILAFLAVIVLSKGGVAFTRYHGFAETAIWFVVGFGVLGSFMNLITRSKWERRIWAPVSILMLICSMIVALSGS